jgi:myo-inositol-1(or 4)-monophosphatase
MTGRALKPAVSPGDARRDLELIRQAAEEGGRIALRYVGDDHALDVRFKNGTSPVSEADLAVDRYLHDTLLAARSDYGWLSEETADSAEASRHSADRTFVVDPIDGTRAYLDGRKQWCVSVAVVEAGHPTAGVLVCPAVGKTYTAAIGGGAYCNEERIGVGPADAVPVIAAPAKLWPLIDEHFAGRVTHHRHVPSLAYRIAMVAEGRLDATIVKPKSHDWDIAAAALILEEAGGILRTLDGESVVLNAQSVAKPAMIAGRESLLSDMFGVVTAAAFG